MYLQQFPYTQRNWKQQSIDVHHSLSVNVVASAAEELFGESDLSVAGEASPEEISSEPRERDLTGRHLSASQNQWISSITMRHLLTGHDFAPFIVILGIAFFYVTADCAVSLLDCIFIRPAFGSRFCQFVWLPDPEVNAQLVQLVATELRVHRSSDVFYDIHLTLAFVILGLPKVDYHGQTVVVQHVSVSNIEMPDTRVMDSDHCTDECSPGELRSSRSSVTRQISTGRGGAPKLHRLGQKQKIEPLPTIVENDTGHTLKMPEFSRVKPGLGGDAVHGMLPERKLTHHVACRPSRRPCQLPPEDSYVGSVMNEDGLAQDQSRGIISR
ncbi:hypothetical protein EVG20_g6999 [Dentipellis fragilis]|uniref:Uncharacterized protein n=1 Tax=Dentipellis fragilis TaxID=205917 RepID=A0A4Y9YGX0_9AGAM|nr:hypothetical protein EVG20_g6999 [Dentipellis fragilis]